MKVIVESFAEMIAKYDPSQNTTRKVLNKYERAALIGTRIMQLQNKAPTLIEVSEDKPLTIHEIAEEELKRRLIPLMIVRSLPNGEKEYWRLIDMDIPGI